MEKHHQIAIIGAGTAGITVAAQLLRKDRALDVAIIDPASKHYYQPAWTLVGAGTYNYKDTERDMAALIPSGAKWIQEAVTSLDPDGNKLTTNKGNVISYDYLVVCPGLKYDFSGIEGLADTIDKNEVCSNYTNPDYTWEVLRNFKGGVALFTQPATPIKCGGAPQKIMYLADDYFRQSGVRKDTTVVFATPGSVIFGVDPFKQTLMQVVDRKEIGLRYFHKITRIDAKNKIAYFKIIANDDDPSKLFHNIGNCAQAISADVLSTAPDPQELFHNPKDIKVDQVSGTEVGIHYDMLHLAPPQAAPDFIQASKLAATEGPDKGWIPVDKHSLQHANYPNVFALGDVAALPTAKTGAAVRKQAPVVVENLLHLIKKDPALTGSYEGYSSCPLVTGYGKMVLAEFKYNNVRDSDPMISKFVDTAKEQWSMWMLKKYMLPFMYWNMMLKGRA